MGNNASLSTRTVWIAAFLASLLSITPLMVFFISGDVSFHTVLIDCFSSAFWQGDLYPRWCMDVDAGLGSPIFLFYFPIPYYFTALIWPLQEFGLSLYNIFVLGSYMASVLTVITCHMWLKDITSTQRALLISILIVFLPYRAEATFFRAGYAEIWCFVWVPLFFKYLRYMVQGKQVVASLAGIIGLMLLTHIPCAVMALVVGGVYVLIMSRSLVRNIKEGVFSIVWALAITSIFIVPAIYFRQFMLPPEQVINPDNPNWGWPNRFMTMDHVYRQGRIVAGDAMAILALACLSMVSIMKSKHITDVFVRREIKAWVIASAVAAFLLFPVSAPVYQMLEPASRVVFPWRMQGAFLFATVFLLAVWVQWFTTAKRIKTWRGDYGMALALLILLSYFMAGVTSLAGDVIQKAEKTQLLAHLIEHRSMYIDSTHHNQDTVFARIDKKPLKATVIKGKGEVIVTQWNHNGIVLDIDITQEATIRLDHHYFPIWYAYGDKEMNLRPEDKTARILLDLPPGKQQVMLKQNIAAPPHGFLLLVKWISATAALLCIYFVLCNKIARMALTRP